MMAFQKTTSQKAKCPMGVGQLAEQNLSNEPIVSEAAKDDKRFRSLQAKLALLGQKLQRTQVEGESGHHYWVSRWGQAIEFHNLDQVDDFLLMIGGVHG